MAGVPFWELVVIAFVAQLMVLPGEKVQFIIAGLSTRYNPLVVVAAAGSAFAGWTIVEIYVGGVIRDVLPGVVLDVFTGALFALFAVLLWRSAPTRDADDDAPTPASEGVERSSEGVETDGGMLAADAIEDATVFGRELPDRFGAFVPIFAMMAAGEFGDKTQLVTIGLAAEYGTRAGIWVGEMLAIVPVSILNAYFFYTFSHHFDVRKAHLAGALVFAFFAFDTALALSVDVSIWETVVEGLASTIPTPNPPA
jgi:putative Ca2+/H+ antiporter (TMEM165/GDT1 family)